MTDKELIDELKDALIWMSGLPCLAPDQPGWEYWEKIRDRLLK